MEKKHSKIFGNKKINIALFLIFIIGVSLYVFRSHIGTIIWGLKYKSPVEWGAVKIKFPKGMIYRMDDKSMQLFYWEEPKGFLYVRKINLEKISRQYLKDFFKSKKFQIIEDEELYFKGFNSFMISYLDTKSKMYNRGIYVIPQNICILYEGKRENYKDFNKLIDGIEFLDKKT